MGSLGSPKTWVPYLNSKDCSQGFCSLYCPQWCYIINPPPPPLDFPDDSNSSSNFSPLVVAVIGILVSAFLLVSYYTIISKYCGNMDQAGGGRRRRSRENDNPDEDFEENHSPSIHEPWHVATNGLDEALIKSITVCKFKKGDELIEGTDCSVCLSEFQDDENVRLLPKCSHAFHIHCIDTWLRSHSNCPLCRAQVVCVNASTTTATQFTPSTTEISSSNESMADNPRLENENGVLGSDQNLERASGFEETEHGNGGFVRKTSSLRAFSDLGNNLEERHTIIDIGDEIRRSISMDHSGRNRVLIADILNNHGGEEEEKDGHIEEESSFGKDGRRKGILNCVRSPVAMKRSVSSGRFFLARPAGTGSGRGRNSVIPL
ncbi:43kDa postsynaptic protein [Parasponia andersonii]|uniref:RING-type E3 ubiquitin transferase n=1 Tax=Parasponia andersonii TaxID=3476 RepID=A0A2P5BGV4_PARAD|nr:43kDa postsynaptic protein [Parasponia andersonii]